ncbi:hypothetical protein [Sphingomonas sanxanigenens]|uniref:hypothetical protein n=1 Tax=Sphingomonas sanxanigenens TaxID=397260 RepID=UPI001301696F|nr:hypothetical protein [Sphingomonas sanxanigenens]
MIPLRKIDIKRSAQFGAIGFLIFFVACSDQADVSSRLEDDKDCPVIYVDAHGRELDLLSGNNIPAEDAALDYRKGVMKLIATPSDVEGFAIPSDKMYNDLVYQIRMGNIKNGSDSIELGTRISLSGYKYIEDHPQKSQREICAVQKMKMEEYAKSYNNVILASIANR